MSQRQILELPDYSASDAFTGLERDVVAFADALTATPADVPDALFERLRSAFSEPAIVELTAAIAWENYLARFNRAFLIGSQGFAEGAFCAVSVHRAIG